MGCKIHRNVSVFISLYFEDRGGGDWRFTGQFFRVYVCHTRHFFWQVKFGVYLCTGGQFLGFVYPGYGQFSYSWLCWDRTSLSASIHA